MRPIFLLDNYDSFTYNLVDQFRSLGYEVQIYRNSISADTIIEKMNACAKKPILVLSPGPGNPSEAGCLLELIGKCVGKFPMIGICLGHQAICQYYGGTVGSAGNIVHGKTSLITHSGEDVFKDLPNPLPVARYHSLIATYVPNTLEVIADYNGMCMAVVDRENQVLGFQFHPESIMTSYGAQLLTNSIKYVTEEQTSTVKDIIEKLYKSKNLTKTEASRIFDEIFTGKLEPVALSSVLTALKLKGETPLEIAGAADSMLKAATKFPGTREFEMGEIVGTGGDGQSTINISTMSSILAASLGLHIAKHGNRSVSSKTGASDLLEQLGVNIRMTPMQAANTYKKVGVTFLFAPTYHASMKYAVPVRQALKTRTIFNVLGPLTNPGRPDYMVMGVYSKDLVEPMAQVLKNNGMKKAIVAHGSGLDEIAVHGDTYMAILGEDGSITTKTVSPIDFGLDTYSLEGIRGGTPDVNKEITLQILSGKGTDAQNAAIAANTSALLVLAGVAKSFKEGAEIAMNALKSGKAMETLKKYVEVSNQEA